MKLINCPACGSYAWKETEKPHGAPYYRCVACWAEFPANEIERMTEGKSQNKKMIASFCDFAGFQDNSDAEMPNIIPSIKAFMSKKPRGLECWDALDDLSFITPECLAYILLKAKDFWGTPEKKEKIERQSRKMPDNRQNNL